MTVTTCIDLNVALVEVGKQIVLEERLRETLDRELVQSDKRLAELVKQRKALSALGRLTIDRTLYRRAGEVKDEIRTFVSTMTEQFSGREVFDGLEHLNQSDITCQLRRMVIDGLLIVVYVGRRGTPSVYKKNTASLHIA